MLFVRSAPRVATNLRYLIGNSISIQYINDFSTNISIENEKNDPYSKKIQSNSTSSSFTSKLSGFFQSLGDRGVGKQFNIANEVLIWGNELNMNDIDINKSKSKLESESEVESNFQPDHDDLGLISRWQTFSDAEYGGSSKCELKFKYPKISENVVTPILSFEGMVDFTENSPIRHISKGGYCALTGYCQGDSINLMEYEGIELLIKTSKPCSFLFSIKPYSMMEDDLYQVILQTTNNSWKRFHLPFSCFTLTARGQINMQQRVLDNLKMKAIGLLMTIPNEPFKIEIRSIKAVHTIDEHVVQHTKRTHVDLTAEDLDALYPMDDMKNIFQQTKMIDNLQKNKDIDNGGNEKGKISRD